MKIIDRLPWDALGPLLFLLVAAGLVFVCPATKRGELIFLIAGAALTRVKVLPTSRTAATNAIPRAEIVENSAAQDVSKSDDRQNK